MKMFKKLAILCLSLTTALAVSAGCSMLGGGNSTPDTSSPTESTTSENVETSDKGNTDDEDGTDDGNDDDGDNGGDGGDSGDGGDGGEVIPPVNVPHDVCEYEWRLTKPFTCTDAGEMTEVCKYNTEHTRAVESIPARGHNYNNNGLCDCGQEPTIPPLPTEGYITPTASNSGVKLSCPSEPYGMYNRYMLALDTPYTAEITATEAYDENTLTYYTDYAFWFEFNVPEPGQYAVISHDNPNHLTIEVYLTASSVGAVATPVAGRTLSDGNFLVTKNFEISGFTTEWISVCRIRGTEVGQTVNFSIVKIDEPAWAPVSQYVEMQATQINGKKAPEGAVGTKPTEIPYESENIYYDETDGYYHLESGEIIYAAISMPAPRQFSGNMAFTNLLDAGTAKNFRIHMTTLPNGNALIYDYIPFILADPTAEGLNYNENSYQAMANSDGLYPVTQELYEFLKLHATYNPPFAAPTAEYKDNAWLAVCYYYKALTPGTEEYPVTLEGAGDYTVQQVEEFTDYYFRVKPEMGEETLYTITVNTYNVTLYIGSVQYANTANELRIQNIPFKATATDDLVFYCFDRSNQKREINITISPMTGSKESPIALPTESSVSLQPIKIQTGANSYAYEVNYVYTATQTGKLTLTSDTTAAITLEDATLTNGSASINVVSGATVTLHVSATNANAITASFAWEPLNGTESTPIAIEAGEQALQPLKLLYPASEFCYEAYYVYTATADGVLTASTASDATISLNGTAMAEDADVVSVNVTAGETVIIYLSSSNADPVDVTLTFTAA